MKEPRKYRKKPVVIYAMQYKGYNAREILQFIGKDARFPVTDEMIIVIETEEGDMVASIDDWIIRGVKGEFYPCKPDIFEMTYEDATIGNF